MRIAEQHIAMSKMSKIIFVAVAAAVLLFAGVMASSFASRLQANAATYPQITTVQATLNDDGFPTELQVVGENFDETSRAFTRDYMGANISLPILEYTATTMRVQIPTDLPQWTTYDLLVVDNVMGRGELELEAIKNQPATPVIANVETDIEEDGSYVLTVTGDSFYNGVSLTLCEAGNGLCYYGEILSKSRTSVVASFDSTNFRERVYDLQVGNGGDSTQMLSVFTHSPAPQIDSVYLEIQSDETLYVGIEGSNFVNDVTVTINGVSTENIQYFGPNSLVATYDASALSAGEYDLVVAKPNGKSATYSVTVPTLPNPVVDYAVISPTIEGGLYVDVYGLNFFEGTVVTLGDTELEVTYREGGYLMATIPDSIAEGEYELKVTNRIGGATAYAETLIVDRPDVEVFYVNPNSVVVDGSDKMVFVVGSNFAEGATVAFGNQQVVVDSMSSTEIFVAVPTQGFTETATVDVTVTNPDGRTYTLADAFTYAVYGPPVISSVNFSESDGKKWMTIEGDGFFRDEGALEVVAFASLVKLNGVALPMCTDGTGLTVAEFEEMFSGAPLPLNASDTAPCFKVFDKEEDSDPWPVIGNGLIKVWLSDDFDTSNSGVVTVNAINYEATLRTKPTSIVYDDSAPYIFNAAAPAVNSETPLQESPTIDKRPTFSGKTVPGSTVTVTVNSDPVVCTTVADSNGDWSCTLPSDLVPGLHSARVVVATPGGETVTYGPYAVNVAAGEPTVITNETPGAPNTGAKRVMAIWLFIVTGSVSALAVGSVIAARRREKADKTHQS